MLSFVQHTDRESHATTRHHPDDGDLMDVDDDDLDTTATKLSYPLAGETITSAHDSMW